MNNTTGYVFLHRKLVDSRVFQNADLLKIFIWCLLKANHKTKWAAMKTGRGETEVKVEPGEFIFGRKIAAKELKMKPSSVRNRMKKLELLFMIGIKSDTHYSIVSVTNWDSYQIVNGALGQAKDNQRTTKGQPKDTTNNDNNDNNDNNKDSCPHSKVVSLYHRILPELPKVQVWTKKRMGFLNARWDEKFKGESGRVSNTLEFWEGYFELVRECDWLMGRVPGRNGDDPFKATLEWLVKPTNFAKTVEHTYDRR